MILQSYLSHVILLPHSLFPPDLGAWLWSLFAVGSAVFAHVPRLVVGSRVLRGLSGSSQLGCKI